MTSSRRTVLLGGAASAALLPLATTAARAQVKEVVIGVIYPLSGASAQIGVDAQKAFETAADIINNGAPGVSSLLQFEQSITLLNEDGTEVNLGF